MKDVPFPKYLYHGTSLDNLEAILAEGITPRGERPSNWPEQPSNSKMVYLSTNQAFAHAALFGTQIVVFEVRLSALETNRLYPDEDYVADVLAHQEGKSYHEIVPHVREYLFWYKRYWKQSVRGMGSAAHRGTIPVKAITRYCTVDLDQVNYLFEVPISSIWQYSILEAGQTQDTRWFFGDTDERHDLVRARERVKELGEDDEFARNSLAYWLKASAIRSGISVVELRRSRRTTKVT